VVVRCRLSGQQAHSHVFQNAVAWRVIGECSTRFSIMRSISRTAMFGTGAVHEKLLQISKGSIWSFDSWPSFTAFLQHWKHCSTTFAPLIHRLSLQHFYSNFYNTGNTSTTRLTFLASVAVFMRQKDTNKTMSCEPSVQASLLRSPWSLLAEFTSHQIEHDIDEEGTTNPEKLEHQYMFLLFDMVCIFKRRKRAMMGNRWKL